MPGGLFFPPREVRISTSKGHTVEYHRALAAILPLGIMTVLLLVCFICARCFGKRKSKNKEHESPARRPQRPRSDPSRPIPTHRLISPDSYSRDDLLHTPSESGFEAPPSFDYMNMSFGYGNNTMAASGRPELEETYKAPRESPALTTTPPFARLRPTPPGLFKKEEDDQPAESRSPSPQTLIHEGKKMRYGAWIRTPSTSSGTSETSQSTMFQMSISDDEPKRLRKEEERKAKDRKKLLKEKRRLKREAKDDQAEIIRQQINWTVKDENDQVIRESKAINIPPRKRIEEHPEFQKVVRAILDENQAEFDETTALNSVWEKGRMEDFLKENLGYLPHQMGVVGGVPAEDFSTRLRDVKEEPENIEEPGDDTKPLLLNVETGASDHGVRRKVLPVTGTKGKSLVDVSQYYVKKVVPVDEAEDISQHGARIKILPIIGARGDTCLPSIHLPVKRVPPEAEAKGEAFQPLLHHHGARSNLGGKKRKASVDNSQPLFHHYGAGKNYGTMLPEVHPIGVFTTGMLDTSVPLVKGKEYEEKRLSEAKKVSSKIAKAVFDIEMKRIEDEMILGHLKTVGKHAVEIHQVPESSGLTRRKQSLGLEDNRHVVEIHQEPSGLTRRKQSPVEDTVVELGSEDTSSSWEDVAPKKKYIWWPGIGDSKKKGAKKKKYGKR